MSEIKNKDDNRASESEIREVLAVELATLLFRQEGKPVSRNHIESLWRSETKFADTPKLFRDHWRDLAGSLQVSLDGFGLRLRPSNSTKVRSRVAVIQTVPARVAFELPTVTADFDQSDEDEDPPTPLVGAPGSGAS